MPVYFPPLGALTDAEFAQDSVGNILDNGTVGDINFTYDDATPLISGVVKNDAITFAKMQNIATARILGRDSGGSGDIEELTAAEVLALIPHASSHSDGGSDAVDVTDLAGFPGGTTTFLRADATFAAPSGSGGVVVQVVNVQTGAVATGTTQVPLDDTIPQNTEGNEYMTLAVTPTDAGNLLRIDVRLQCSLSSGNWISVALFQDTTANALAAIAHHQTTPGGGECLVLTHTMTAGTTSATTFKVRAGTNVGGSTLTVNGNGGARWFGGVMASSITITELVP